MSAIYNENDPYAARWLENLVAAGHIAPGAVSAKSILDLEGHELAGVRQAHFFAGIGVWSAALRAAGWPDTRPVWTGSCPCQPFSAAGKGGRFADERHLWPFWFWLIEQHRPDVIFGEQVEGPAGRAWLDLVFADLEGIGYAVGAVVFPASGVGAPHGRHRTYWVARAAGARRNRALARPEGQAWNEAWLRLSGEVGGLGELADATEARRRTWRGKQGNEKSAWNARGIRLAQRNGFGFWNDVEWIPCRDGKWRPAQPGTFPLAHGASARVGRLRAYGNAIVLQQAQAFIEAFIEAFLEVKGLSL